MCLICGQLLQLQPSTCVFPRLCIHTQFKVRDVLTYTHSSTTPTDICHYIVGRVTRAEMTRSVTPEL